MGPKKQKQKSGGKKAEKLRLQKEEEERRLKEEEEARLQAEQEEADRRKKEKLLRERMAKLEAIDRERREDELAELNSMLEKFMCAQRKKTEDRAYEKWERYIACDESPDPTVLQEINTFMSLWREEQNEDIQFVMEKGEQVLNFIEKLQFLLLDAPPSEVTEKETAQYQETILDLESLLHQKYNEATDRLLKSAILYEDFDTGNMQVVIKDKNVTFCIWGNLKKKIRFKNHVFGDTHHGFDLPKSLAVSSVAVRIFHTHYDHVSPLWLRCPRVTRLEDLDSEETTQHSQDSVGEPGEKEAREEPNVTAEKEIPPEERNSAASVREDTNVTANINEVTKEEKTEKESEILDVPPEGQSPEMQEKTSEEEEITDESTKESTKESPVDMQQFAPVGGVFHIDGLQLPPQVQQINSWSAVELLDDGLETYPYPPEEPEGTTHPPIQITLRPPGNVFYLKEPLIARWDPAGQQWRTDGISNISYQTQEGNITFEMDAFYTVAFLQDNHINMPYQAWELQPTSTDEAVFVITTVFAEVKIQIKAPLTEFKAYQQIALVASAFAFGRSKWNLESGQDQVVFKVSEHLNADSVKDEDWSVYMFNGRRAQKLKITEESEAFSEELEEDTEFHSTLYHMLKDFASKEAIDKVNTAHFQFVDVVYQLLLDTRVLMYS
ncbi:protein CASC1 isoform X1 [Coturnix japonica]|uniref:protein CASC1 isoform X1 n=1 Tax=Coturnix japonica TaxID=93934 RepID=UPI000777D944|nr:protein CASC1 isoform X1 [Coturnix japonica]